MIEELRLKIYDSDIIKKQFEKSGCFFYVRQGKYEPDNDGQHGQFSTGKAWIKSLARSIADNADIQPRWQTCCKIQRRGAPQV